MKTLMPPQPAPISKTAFWTGYTMSALPVLLLLFSGVMKLMKPPAVAEGFVLLGYPESLALSLGVVELACTVAYVIPQTSVLGAILLTGYLGGATATNVRVGDSFIMPVLVGVFVWGGLFLRDQRLRALLPLRRRLEQSSLQP
jgi:DoxX-like family